MLINHINPKGLLYSGTLLLLILFSPQLNLATHNLAGQITLERNDPNNPNSYTITLTTYSDPSEAGVDRCAADIQIYSALNLNPIVDLVDIPRSNGPRAPIDFADCDVPGTRVGEEVRGAIKRNIYKVDYIFPGPGEYYLHYFDIARLSNVTNICSSNEKAFTVVTRFIYNPILGSNSSPVFLNEPIYDACVGKPWSHNPGGFDQDGDSLVYYLVPSEDFDDTQSFNPQTNPRPVCYTFPDDQATFSSNGPLVQDSVTGLITWLVPNQVGVYNISYVVEEYRDGLFLGFVQRDMAVFVNDCENNPPVIETLTDTCIFAGETLEFPFLAYDPDSTDSLYLSLNNGALGNNGPFSLSPPATLEGVVIDPLFGEINRFNSLPTSTFNGDITPVDTIKGVVRWNTTCDMIRSQIYQVDFFANDNFIYSIQDNSLTTLTDNKTVQIRVVPPPPEGLMVEKGPRSVSLSWMPTPCNELVLGYFIYRKIDGQNFDQDTVCCEVSPEDAGFELIHINEGWENITYLDSLSDVEGGYGDQICYAITAIYADPIQPQVPKLESCAESGCVEIENSEIFLTQADVEETSIVTGQILVEWTEPEIDTLFPAPYTYKLFRANNNSFPAIEIAELPFSQQSFLDEALDTEIRNYNYRIEVFDAAGLPINLNKDRHIGSSIFLDTRGGSNEDIFLEWTEEVPWENDLYFIFRSANGAPFEVVDSLAGTGSNMHSYRDTALQTDVEYCYFIRSRGSHKTLGIASPLFNDSQISCDRAVDDEAPCNPDLSLSNQCLNELAELTITKPSLGCDDDAEFISIFYKSSPEDPYQEILRLPYPSFGRDTVLQDFIPGEDLVGCFTVTVTDSAGNESEPGVENCVDFCPKLILPNVFTPNGDGSNDFWIPIEFRDVSLVQVNILDRWGRLVSRGNGSFAQLWDGITDDGREASEGTYFYYLEYEELGILGNVRKEVRGSLTLLR